MMCKACGKEHCFKARFVEWSDGVAIIEVWSPCNKTNIICRQMDSNALFCGLLNTETFDVDVDFFLKTKTAKA